MLKIVSRLRAGKLKAIKSKYFYKGSINLGKK